MAVATQKPQVSDGAAQLAVVQLGKSETGAPSAASGAVLTSAAAAAASAASAASQILGQGSTF